MWTDLLQGGYRPNPDGFGFTAVIEISVDGAGTLYRAIALHRTAEQRKEHEDKGFHEGWGMAADQLETLALSL